MKLRSALPLLLLIGCGAPPPSSAPTPSTAKTCDAPSFASAVRYGGTPGTRQAAAIGVGDFDRNGTLDLAMSTGDVVLLLSGPGDGTFQASISHLDTPGGLAVGGLAVGGLAVADYDGDGRPDLALSLFDPYGGAPHGLSILRAGEDGRFQQAAAYLPRVSVSGVEAADLDGDGWKELVGLAQRPRADRALTEAAISVLSPGGPLTSPASFQYTTEYSPAQCPTAFRLADFDGDGRIDLVVADGCGARPLWILRGKGDGTFAAPSGLGPAGTYADSVTVADLNGDGRADLVASFNPDLPALDCCYIGPSTFFTFLGHGDGTFEPPAEIPGLPGTGRAITADFNGDGYADLAVANPANPSRQALGTAVVVLFGRGDGGFRTLATYDVGATPDDIVAGDFDGDGRPDLATANADRSVAVLTNTCGK